MSTLAKLNTMESTEERDRTEEGMGAGGASAAGPSSGPSPIPESPVAAFIASAAKDPTLRAPTGKYCCVVGCHNCQGRDGPKGIRFHAFPKDESRRERWIKSVNRYS